VILVAGICSIQGLVVTDPWNRLGFLEAAALVTVALGLEIRTDETRQADLLTVVAISALSLVTSDVLWSAESPIGRERCC